MDKPTHSQSPAGLQALLLKASTTNGYDHGKLTEAECWGLHSYNYAFRRIYLNNHSKSYPLDPEGEWYNPELIKAAMNEWRPRKARSGITAAEEYARKGDHEMAAHCRRQDAERAASAHLSDAEYAALCLRQVKHNVLIFEERSKRR